MIMHSVGVQVPKHCDVGIELWLGLRIKMLG